MSTVLFFFFKEKRADDESQQAAMRRHRNKEGVCACVCKTGVCASLPSLIFLCVHVNILLAVGVLLYQCACVCALSHCVHVCA